MFWLAYKGMYFSLHIKKFFVFVLITFKTSSNWVRYSPLRQFLSWRLLLFCRIFFSTKTIFLNNEEKESKPMVVVASLPIPLLFSSTRRKNHCNQRRDSRARMCKPFKELRNQPILAYRSARLHRNLFLGSLNVYKFGLSHLFCVHNSTENRSTDSIAKLEAATPEDSTYGLCSLYLPPPLSKLQRRWHQAFY